MMGAATQNTWHRSLQQLLDGLVSCDVPACNIEFVTMDSRRVKPGTLFLATAGTARHGLEFAQQAWANGAAAILFEPAQGIAAPLPPKNKVLLPVDNLSAHLGTIAARFFEHPSKQMKVCGVTGTNGKTSITHLIARALRFVGKRCGQMGTLGFGLNEPLTMTGLTTPDAVAVQQNLAWLREQRATHMAMEVSSHALQQYRVKGVEFDCAVLTNLTRDHLDYHGDIESYAAAKQRLFEDFSINKAVINVDDAFGRQLVAAIQQTNVSQSGARELTSITAVSTEAGEVVSAENALIATSIDAHPQGLKLTFDYFQSGQLKSSGTIESPLLGAFNAQNILCALGVMLHWEIGFDQSVASLSSVKAPPGRMETFGRLNEAQIVVDYAHTPDALSSAIAALRAHCQGQLWCVFGCGGDRDRGKRPFMARAAEQADRVILTNDNPRHENPDQIAQQTLAGFNDPSIVVIELDRAKAIEFAVTQAAVDDIVLIAGKGHEDYQVVGNKKLPLSDRHLVATLLKQLKSDGNQEGDNG